VEDAVNPFSRETEEVLRRARLTEAMPVDKRRRLKAAVLARLAAGGFTLVAGEAAAGAGFWASATGAAVKSVAALAFVASVGAGGYIAARPSPAHPVAQPSVAFKTLPVVVAPPPEVARAVDEPDVRDAALVHAPRARTARAPEKSKLPIAVEAPLPPAATSTAVAALPTNSTLAEETRLLREADRALRAGNAEAALAFVDEHAARFPDGILAPERAAERLIALCQSGKADAAAAGRFLSGRAGSPLAARVRQACGVR
jgi:RNA polymerase sigma-70 factor (ECF subfamily)